MVVIKRLGVRLGRSASLQQVLKMKGIRTISCAASLNFVRWIGSASESLCRGLGSRWVTERFHRNALVTHFQHGQVFCTARQLKDYAVTRCRLHQRASQRGHPADVVAVEID